MCLGNADVVNEEQQEAGVLERWFGMVCPGAGRGEKGNRLRHPAVIECQVMLAGGLSLQAAMAAFILYVEKAGLMEVM